MIYGTEGWGFEQKVKRVLDLLKPGESFNSDSVLSFNFLIMIYIHFLYRVFSKPEFWTIFLENLINFHLNTKLNETLQHLMTFVHLYELSFIIISLMFFSPSVPSNPISSSLFSELYSFDFIQSLKVLPHLVSIGSTPSSFYHFYLI